MGLPSKEKRIQKREAEIEKLRRLEQKKGEEIYKAEDKCNQLDEYQCDDPATTKCNPDGVLMLDPDVLEEQALILDNRAYALRSIASGLSTIEVLDGQINNIQCYEHEKEWASEEVQLLEQERRLLDNKITALQAQVSHLYSYD
ncbi:hypothetical protein FE257_007906 [Aspergillus nanangensis]|uniref:Uncharacterized protein n=1 Tax=Aspergillus nanangensis TaxID=2582783 RepID=A0AAD4H071_ASPNN|nr:hypothetical protein FE257_007906 [Aspergillus nanangensis]